MSAPLIGHRQQRRFLIIAALAAVAVIGTTATANAPGEVWSCSVSEGAWDCRTDVSVEGAVFVGERADIGPAYAAWDAK